MNTYIFIHISIDSNEARDSNLVIQLYLEVRYIYI